RVGRQRRRGTGRPAGEHHLLHAQGTAAQGAVTRPGRRKKEEGRQLPAFFSAACYQQASRGAVPVRPRSPRLLRVREPQAASLACAPRGTAVSSTQLAMPLPQGAALML